jgi:Zn-dependent protease with chaperone function
MTGHHRSQAILVFSFAWSFPQLFIGALIWRSVPSFEESVLLSAAVGALTATGMLLYYHLLRAQEFEADVKVVKFIGGSASASLSAHLAAEESHEARIRVLASHPSNDDRIDRLATHTLQQADLPAP